MIRSIPKGKILSWLPWCGLWLALFLVLQQLIWPIWQEIRQLRSTLSSAVHEISAEVNQISAPEGEGVLLSIPERNLVDLLQEIEKSAVANAVHVETLEILPSESLAEAPGLQCVSMNLQAFGSFDSLHEWLGVLEEELQPLEIASWQLRRQQQPMRFALQLTLQFWGKGTEDGTEP